MNIKTFINEQVLN